MILHCGLRRCEVAAPTMGPIQPRDGRWCIVRGGTAAWRGRRITRGLRLARLQRQSLGRDRRVGLAICADAVAIVRTCPDIAEQALKAERPRP